MTTAALAPIPGERTQHTADDDFAGLFRSYHPQLLRYVTHHFGSRDADEITQESLTRALRSLDRDRSDAETWAWLIRVARNIAYDFARSRRLCESTDDDAVLRCEAPSDSVLPEPAALLDERRSMVRRALKVLPPTQRRILVLYEVDDLNCPTIAHLVGSTEDAVRKSLQRARRRFAAEVRALGGGSAGIACLLRVMRRRPRGMSALAASTAICAVAGGVVLTVSSSPATTDLAPRVAKPVSATSHELDSPKGHGAVTRAAAPARTGARAVPAASRQGPGTDGSGTNGLVVVPKTPLSPGQKTRVKVVVHTSGGPVVVGARLTAGEGVVCSTAPVECEQ